MNASFVSHWHYIMHVILSVRDGSETCGGSKGQIVSNLQLLLPAWISVIPTLCNWWPRMSRWSLVGILRTLTNMQQDLLSLNYGEESSVVPYFKDVLVFFEGNTSAHIDMIVPIPAWPLKGPSEWCVQFRCLASFHGFHQSDGVSLHSLCNCNTSCIMMLWDRSFILSSPFIWDCNDRPSLSGANCDSTPGCTDDWADFSSHSAKRFPRKPLKLWLVYTVS